MWMYGWNVNEIEAKHHKNLIISNPPMFLPIKRCKLILIQSTKNKDHLQISFISFITTLRIKVVLKALPPTASY